MTAAIEKLLDAIMNKGDIKGAFAELLDAILGVIAGIIKADADAE